MRHSPESEVMKRILIIDDEPGIADLICDALTKFGYTVSTAPSGREGLRRLNQTVFDLVVTDMSMPDMDGAEVVRAVRRSDRPQTPVIGISGTPWLLEGVDCDAVLHKPFRLLALIDTIKCLNQCDFSAPPNPLPLPMIDGARHTA